MENTLIIVAGDHGEAFGEHGEKGHAFFCYQENLKVPLIFHCPGSLEGGRIVRDRVSLVDIYPTICDLFDWEIPTGTERPSLAPALISSNTNFKRSIYIESTHGYEEMGWAPLTGLIDEDFKFISLPEPELYNLTKDPAERENLFFREEARARSLDEKLAELIKEGGRESQPTRRNIDRSEKEILQSLGYLSAFSGKEGRGMDPKTGILINNQLESIRALIQSGDLDEARRQLAHFIVQNPDDLVPQYFGIQDELLQIQRAERGIIENWLEAITRFPENVYFRINLALAYQRQWRSDKAIEVCEDILTVHPEEAQALILLADITKSAKGEAAAEDLYKRALEADPGNLRLQMDYSLVLEANGKGKEAEELCLRLLETTESGRNTSLRARAAGLLVKMGKDKPAFPILLDAVKSKEADVQSWNDLGIIYFRRGDPGKAADSYNRALGLDPNNAVTFNNLGTLHLSEGLRLKDEGRLDKALADYNRALEIDPGLASALNGRASLFRFSGRTEEAVRDWRAALSADSLFADVYFNLAVTLLETGKKMEAGKVLEECRRLCWLRLSPSDKERLERLASEIQCSSISLMKIQLPSSVRAVSAH